MSVDSGPPGATGPTGADGSPAADGPTGADWDPEFAALTRGDLLPRLAARAYGAAYPFALRPYGATTWPLLREIADRLATPRGGTLLDLGCGEGGPGLWLAREAGAALVALDFSAEARRAAVRTAAAFPQAPPHRVVAGTFTATGLPAASVDAAVSLDALTYCADPAPALAELRRVLRPGARAALTLHEVDDERDGVVDHRPLAAAAGLRVAHRAEVPGWREPTRRLYALWRAHAAELRAELGGEVAEVLLAEADRLGDHLDHRRQVLLVVARPPDADPAAP